MVPILDWCCYSDLRHTDAVFQGQVTELNDDDEEDDAAGNTQMLCAEETRPESD